MRNWRYDTLAGGLPLVQLHRPGVGLVAARLWIRGGSSVDPGGQRGAMQLLAGVMSRGCGALDAEQLADLVEGCGAALRSEAHEDALVLSLKCASSDAAQLLPLLLTMARDPRLDADQIAIERRLNLQTLQRQQEDPFQQAHDRLRQLLYGEGPYGHDPLGVEAELDGLDRQHLLPLLDGVGSQGALLVVCGDLPEPEALAALLNRSLAVTPWSTSAPTPPSPLAEIPAPDGAPHGDPGGDPDRADLALAADDTEQVVLMLGAATVPLGHPDALPLRLLQSHLGLGMSSRLFVLMREERGLVYDVGVHLPARCGASPFVWHLSTSAENAAEALAVLLEEWDGLLERPISDAALDLARAKFRGQDAMGRQTCGQVADRQALVLGHGLQDDFVSRTLVRAAELSPAELQAAAARQLRHPRLSLCGPQGGLDAAAAVWQRRRSLSQAMAGSR